MKYFLILLCLFTLFSACSHSKEFTCKEYGAESL